MTDPKTVDMTHSESKQTLHVTEDRIADYEGQGWVVKGEQAKASSDSK